MFILQNIERDHIPPYFDNLILMRVQSPYSLRTTKEITLFGVKHEFFKNSFFPSTLIVWNKLDHSFAMRLSLVLPSKLH